MNNYYPVPRAGSDRQSRSRHDQGQRAPPARSGRFVKVWDEGKKKIFLKNKNKNILKNKKSTEAVQSTQLQQAFSDMLTHVLNKNKK